MTVAVAARTLHAWFPKGHEHLSETDGCQGTPAIGANGLPCECGSHLSNFEANKGPTTDPADDRLRFRHRSIHTQFRYTHSQRPVGSMLSGMSYPPVSESDEQLRSVKEAIAYLSSVDLWRKDSETGSRVGQAVFNLVRDGYSRNRMLIAGEKIQISRGRVGASGRPFAKVSQLWYPPAQSVRINRANLPGECVFYSGTSRATAIVELKPKLGDLITLFEARAAKETVWIKIVDYGDYFASAHLAERHRLFEQFTNEIFRKTITSQRHYMISAAIVSLLLRYDDALDGVMYSSVASDLVGANVVYPSPRQ